MGERLEVDIAMRAGVGLNGEMDAATWRCGDKNFKRQQKAESSYSCGGCDWMKGKRRARVKKRQHALT
jgi:hypothetical protein